MEGEAIHLYLETSTHSAIHSLLSIPSRHQLWNGGARNCCKRRRRAAQKSARPDWNKADDEDEDGRLEEEEAGGSRYRANEEEIAEEIDSAGECIGRWASSGVRWHIVSLSKRPEHAAGEGE